MKNLDLNSYGVQEMNAQEVKQVEGGIFLLVAAGVLLAELCKDGITQCYDDMMT